MARDEPYRLVRSAHDYPGVPAARARLRPLRRRRVRHRVDVGWLRRHPGPGAARARAVRRGRRAVGDLLAVVTASPTRWVSGSRCASPNPPRWTGSRSRWASTASPACPSAGCASTAGGQVRDAVVDPATGLVDVGLDGRPVDRVRVTVTGVAGTDGVVTMREISFPGVEIGRRLVVPDAGRPRHHLRPARATAAARVHRRRPGRGLRLRHRRTGRRGGVGHGARHHRDRGRLVGRRGRGGGTVHPGDPAVARADPGEHPRHRRPRPTGTRPTWAPSSRSTATPSASGRRRRVTRARPCGCDGPTAAC